MSSFRNQPTLCYMMFCILQFLLVFSMLVFTFQFSKIFIGMCSLDITACFIKASNIMYFELINTCVLALHPFPTPISLVSQTILLVFFM